MALKVEDFEPVSNGDLKEFWERYRDRDVRRLILEVVRARRVMDRAFADAQKAQHECWQKKDHSGEAMLKPLTDRLGDEKVRLGSQGGNVVKLESDWQYRSTT